MYKLLFYLFTIVILPVIKPGITNAQVVPANGDTLNYRLVGFHVPDSKKAARYMLEVWQNGSNDAAVRKTYSTNKIIETLPAFGKKYKWQISYINKKNKKFDSTGYQTFYIAENPFSDTGVFRVTVLDTSEKYKDIYVFYDNARSLFDMQGNPLWFLPNTPGGFEDHSQLRDIKLTNEGTITVVGYANVYELDYDGNVIWSAPNDGKVGNDTTEHYHHEFTRLSNGNYMTIGRKFVERNMPAGSKGRMRRSGPVKEGKISVPTGTLIEYDPQGNVVWTWYSDRYFTDKDLFTALPGGDIRPSTHFNAFYFDEKNKVVYASFRDISRVVKIKYPSGEILAEYGDAFVSDKNIKGDGMFYAQHACRINADGNLYLFNNNNPLRISLDSNKNRTSGIAVFKEPVKADEELVKLWEFSCDIDSHANSFSPGGGGVYELESGDYIVCMGAVNRNFIITKNKKIDWNIIMESRPQGGGNWMPASGYRIYPVLTRKQLEKLVFYNKLKN